MVSGVAIFILQTFLMTAVIQYYNRGDTFVSDWLMQFSDDGDVRFVLETTGRHDVPLGHIFLIPIQPIFALRPLVLHV